MSFECSVDIVSSHPLGLGLLQDTLFLLLSGYS